MNQVKKYIHKKFYNKLYMNLSNLTEKSVFAYIMDNTWNKYDFRSSGPIYELIQERIE